ncbi:MAG: PD40 domain-containing protein, partial [Fibrobacteria bacterium]|nr:PD40 domain-containing protein [Fibrobacteria bacterium]
MILPNLCKRYKILFLTILVTGLLLAGLCQCAKSGTGPDEDKTGSPVAGIWKDSVSAITFNFDDSTWWSGLNQGTYNGKKSGELILFGQPYASYELEGNVLTVTELLEGGDTFLLLLQSDIPPVYVYESSLTRKGNFLAFTSNRGGHETGDVFVYTVDSNANKDSIYYYELVITITQDTVFDTVSTDPLEIDTAEHTLTDSTLVKHLIPPIRALTDRDGVDAMPSWSPDGRKIAFVSDRSGNPAIWIFLLDAFGGPLEISDSVSHNPVQLTAPGRDAGDANPTWSPDGNTIAFERKNIDGSVDDLRDIYMVPATAYGDESKVVNFTSAPEHDCFNPEWSPRSEVNIILFEQRQNGTSSDWDVYWMYGSDSVGFNPDDKDKKATNPNRNGHPTWAPHCQAIAFERNPPGNDSAYDINIQQFALQLDSSGDSTIEIS